jgi:8-oxo-dGTP pyrophosphatase MutT (NUDIX family)
MTRVRWVLAPATDARTGAAVAVVLAPRGDDLELLYIRRPRRDGDRWSGDLAFPGGLARTRESAVQCARREAAEEVGLALGPPLGLLRDRTTAHPRRARPMRVRPVVFAAATDAALVEDPREVAEAFWVPLRRLVRLPPVLAIRRVARLPLPVPALDLDGHILWGLTLAMTFELRRLVEAHVDAL